MKYKCSVSQISVLQVDMKLCMLYLADIYTYSSKNNEMVSWRQEAKEAVPVCLVLSTLHDQQLWSSYGCTLRGVQPLLEWPRWHKTAQKRGILPWWSIEHLCSSTMLRLSIQDEIWDPFHLSHPQGQHSQKINPWFITNQVPRRQNIMQPSTSFPPLWCHSDLSLPEFQTALLRFCLVTDSSYALE